MLTKTDLVKMNTVVLQFAIEKIRQTPSQVLQGADNGIMDYLEEVSNASGVAVGWLEAIPAHLHSEINDEFARWSNAADAGKYGATPDDAEQGWLVLSWALTEAILRAP